jgi:hypothetical protein
MDAAIVAPTLEGDRVKNPAASLGSGFTIPSCSPID